MLPQHTRGGEQYQRQHPSTRELESFPRYPDLGLAPDRLLALAAAETDDHSVEFLLAELFAQIPRHPHAHFEVDVGIGRGEARQDRWQLVRDEVLGDA